MEQGLPRALKELVDRASESIREGLVVDAFLAGGTATFLHLQRAGGQLAEQARYSEDADIQFSRRLLLLNDIVVHYEDSNGSERCLTLDRTYSIDIGLRHPDCMEDAELLWESSNGRIRLHLLSSLDLAVTKVGRYETHDRLDIQLLARAGLLTADRLRQRATEALDYLATDPAMVKIHIEEAVELIQDAY